MPRFLLSTTSLIALLIAIGASVAPKAHAVERPVIVSKVMDNSALSSTRGSVNVPTLTKQTEIITVTLYISNPEDKIDSLTVKDYLGDTGKSFELIGGEINQYEVNNAGKCNAASGGQLHNDAGSTVNYIQFDTNRLKKGTQYCIVYSLKPSSGMFPTYKGRLVGYPTYVTQPNSTVETLTDIGYVYINPVASSSLAGSLYNDGTDFDLGVLVPGVSVTVTSGGPTIKGLTTPPTFYLQPNSATSTPANVGDRQCGVRYAGIGSKSRGGGCVFSTTAAVYNTGQANPGSELDTANAFFMTLPSSTIIGNVYAGSNSNLDTSKLLLPGQHVTGSGTASTTSRSSSNVAYSIDQKSVSGWDPSSSNLYKNVYQTANIARLTRNPNLLIQPTVVSGVSSCPTTLPVNMSCVMTGSGASAIANFTLTSTTDFKINLGASNLAGNSSGTTPSVAATKDGYVAYIKGNLTVGTSGAAQMLNITNEVGGTIIVSGILTLNNVNLNKGSGALGLVVLGVDNGATKAVSWNTEQAFNSTLDLVSFFAPSGTFRAVKAGQGSLKLNGSIVADTVDLSGVKPGTTEDDSGILIQYPQALTQNPPPGFNLFSASPILKDAAP